MDRRRRQYVPMSVYLASSNTGQRIMERFGIEGLGVWAAYLCACKTNWIQGQVTYAGEADGLTKLGLYPHKPAFTLDEFFDFTGRLKLTKRMQDTRKRGAGQVQDVRCTKWDDWNKDVDMEVRAERKARKRAQNTGTMNGHNGDKAETIGGPEVEGEDEYRTRGRARPGGRASALPEPRSRTCPECGVVIRPPTTLTDHLWQAHDIEHAGAVA